MMLKVTLYKQCPQKAVDISVWETDNKNKKKINFKPYVFYSLISPTVAKIVCLDVWISRRVGSCLFIKVSVWL